MITVVLTILFYLHHCFAQDVYTIIPSDSPPLTSLFVPQSCSDVLDVVESKPTLSTLATIFKSDILEEELRGQLFDPSFGGIICAPTDDAFDQFFDDNTIQKSTFLANSPLLNEIVKANIIPGGLPGGSPPSDGQEVSVATLAAGQELTIRNNNGSIFVGDPLGTIAQVIEQDTSACGGVVSVIDRVLAPGNLADLVGTNVGSNCLSVLEAVQQIPSLTQLEALFQADVLDEDIKQSLLFPELAAVIRSPNNNAFTNFYDKYQIDQMQLLSNSELVNQLVRLLIVPIGGGGSGVGDLPTEDGNSISAPTLLPDQLIITTNNAGILNVQDPNGNVGRIVQAFTTPCIVVLDVVDIVLEPIGIQDLIPSAVTDPIVAVDTSYIDDTNMAPSGESPTAVDIAQIDNICLDVVAAVQTNTDLSILAQVFQADALEADLRSSLTNPDYRSVILAPTNAAFTNFFDQFQIDQPTFLTNSELLNQVVKANIIPGGLPATALSGDAKKYNTDTLLDNQQLTIFSEGGAISVQGPDGRNVTVQGFSDPGACNSGIALLDGVILPQGIDSLVNPDQILLNSEEDQNSCRDVLSVTEQQSDLTTLTAAFKSAALDYDLWFDLGDVNFQATICAPTDDAFAQFFDTSGIEREEFLGDSELLNRIIKVNIIPGEPGAPDDGQSATVPTLLDGNELRVQNSGGIVTAQGPRGPLATVQQFIDDPCQSVLAVIDQVLLPEISTAGEDFLP
eukprot:TRINITY_DN4161_c0_g1_i10.p1 TRINITY_DN4161_c0_g1~~TRINITY_DN4161_c0_g1_i10.p1  ORF type:complete len:735 (-),score=172.93 TRINITY_DN4161_c0_g1_i10:403-2607(-)